MTLELIIRYLHFLAILLVFGSLLVEIVLVKKTLPKKMLKLIGKIDALYGLAILLLFGAGLSLWFWVGKPSEFYSQNPIFILKFVLVCLVGILSIWPTIFFIKNQKGNDEDVVKIPSYIRKIILVEVVLLLVVPMLAVLMARGVGL
jgi:putative membrane protein